MKKLTKRQKAIQKQLLKMEKETSKQNRKIEKLMNEHGESNIVYILKRKEYELFCIDMYQKSKKLIDEFERIEKRKEIE